MNVFYFIDAAAYNAFVMYRTKKPESMAMRPKVQRRMHLEDLGKALCEVAQGEETEFRGVTKHLQEVAHRHDVVSEAGVRPILAGARSRCYLCPRRLDKKTKNRCGLCDRPACKDHAVQDKVMCTQCVN